MLRGRQELVLAILTIVVMNLLWVYPPLGFAAAVVVMIVVPPWGRSLAERGVISVLVLLGTIALAVPRASEVPITATSAHIGLAIFLAALMALRFIPGLQRPVPRPSRLDLLIAAFAAVCAGWLVSIYVGRSAHEIVSGLYFSGWDNQGHFTPFANTVRAGATLWPTADGSVAWNQWYPSLHTTVWALAQLASQATGEALGRVALLWPYVQWTAVSFSLSLAALAWVAGDLARRGVQAVLPSGRWQATWAPVLAILAFAAFGLFGSPAWLFNFGFTNFVMAVAVMTTTAYLSARSWASARTIGWLLIPLGALAINALWTPLVLGIVPSAFIVLIAMWRLRRWLAPLWAVVSAGIVGGSVVYQARAIADVAPGQSGSFLEDLGAVGIGMAPFNIGVACAAPVVAVLIGVALLRGRRAPLAVAVAGASMGVSAFLVVTMYAAGLADVARLYSYYVLKTLDALLLTNAPLLAALTGAVGIIGVHALKRHIREGEPNPLVNRANAAIVVTAALVLGFLMFGYVGQRPDEFTPGFAAAAGIEAGAVRAQGVGDPLVGEAIIQAQQATGPYPDDAPMLWDGSGTLPNLWLASLHSTLSVKAHTFYKNLPQFPYDDKTPGYVELALGVNHDLNLVIAYFREASGPQVIPLEERNPGRVTVVKVPMRPSPLCEECSL